MPKKISKKTAKTWVADFKKNGKAAKSAMFTKESVLNILNQEGCEGLRIYNAWDEELAENKATMFLVGTDAKGENLLPVSEESLTEIYSIEDDARPCPPSCPKDDL